MTIEEFISSNPSRKAIAHHICLVANTNVLEVDETYVWEPLSKLGNFDREDFYDDVQGTFAFYGQEALEIYGIVNWRLKGGDDLGLYGKS